MQTREARDAEMPLRPMTLLIAVCFVIAASSIGTLAALLTVFAGR